MDIDHAEESDDAETVLAIDGGLRKDATAVVVNEDGGQLSTPYFIPLSRRTTKLCFRTRSESGCGH